MSFTDSTVLNLKIEGQSSRSYAKNCPSEVLKGNRHVLTRLNCPTPITKLAFCIFFAEPTYTIGNCMPVHKVILRNRTHLNATSLGHVMAVITNIAFCMAFTQKPITILQTIQLIMKTILLSIHGKNPNTMFQPLTRSTPVINVALHPICRIIVTTNGELTTCIVQAKPFTSGILL